MAHAEGLCVSAALLLPPSSRASLTPWVEQPSSSHKASPCTPRPTYRCTQPRQLSKEEGMMGWCLACVSRLVVVEDLCDDDGEEAENDRTLVWILGGFRINVFGGGFL